MTAVPVTSLLDTIEGQRLAKQDAERWREWGPYLSERQWGTVREDYSADGDAWAYFPHEHARSRAYRWGEDGLAGFSDKAQRWCLGLALWNEQDAILKERLFGLNNAEGNHGEDVKELYFFVDGIPSHAYMRMLYKYPHAAFPYTDLIAENARRGLGDAEYEILDTGVFEDNRYCDVSVEYAKHQPDDIFMRITVHNRSDQPTRLQVLPQLWARNDWSWTFDAPKPRLTLEGGRVLARHHELDDRQLSAWGQDGVQWLFCENETNFAKLDGQPTPGPFKDGINDYVVEGDQGAIRRDVGTKVAAHFSLELAGQESKIIYLRFAPVDAPEVNARKLFALRRQEADEFYAALQQGIADDDARNVQRQALAGLLWSKQLYYFDVNQWLDGDPDQPAPPPERLHIRNTHWRHLSNFDILSMPDTWEYPWYASWDQGFQAVAMALIDPGYAKQQLLLLVKDRFMHPNGQLPAYEWRFDDANPPVHAWASWRVYQQDKALTGVGDMDFLERIFHKLLLNFSWWVNRKDAEGRNLFQGGFLGLDNIALFDRSAALPPGYQLDQADGTAWVAAYALDLMRIGLELAKRNVVYVDIAVKFFEHFLYIAGAINRVDDSAEGLWDEQDLFFYDVLHRPDGQGEPVRLRSIVGLMPLFAVLVLEQREHEGLEGLRERLLGFMHHRPDLAKLVSRWNEPGQGNRLLLALLRGERTKDLLRRMLDDNEFLSAFGVRSLSKAFAEQPLALKMNGDTLCASYQPGESDSRLYGGNSNWRGPLWMPVNYMLIESLREFHRYYADNFSVEYPTGSGYLSSMEEVADSLSQRLTRLFLRDENGLRPSMAGYAQLEADPASRDLVLFHEYFHGETGRGLGASHQTGWSALVALLLQPRI
ncbi:MGH1-like glycoside hydrolase domain-containing protein [Pseudomonas haemolytica]|uniref:Glucosidase n=1 Tax=Pseudomonas haemolytica TaxID=2600065 RepID=A0A5P1DDY3_9PSED|nr:glucosidase [Pseudomonas haemolytica]MBJ2249057.1 glucosidase [Pseudomonas haemolytica]MBJ2275418.1 glucosidase [Pseudomonas haemolytica]MBK3446405.1 glucosidase [Pseudomonas haemolytica]MBK3457901.1 glucosidase [Pseudomonas haemolytica]MRJ38724.1 glucosidase [Pseudomonas haemolytica]